VHKDDTKVRMWYAPLSVSAILPKYTTLTMMYAGSVICQRETCQDTGRRCESV
jgi:hypothetical protein